MDELYNKNALRALELVLDDLRIRTGFDFTQYGTESLWRRLHRLLPELGLRRLEALPAHLDAHPWLCGTVVEHITVNVTSMFRDPEAFATLYRLWRPQSVPERYRVWVAGCSTGEEIWTLCLLWVALGWTERVEVWGTDLSDRAIERAGSGRIRLKQLPDFQKTFSQFQSLVDWTGHTQLTDYFDRVYGDDALLNEECKPRLSLGFDHLGEQGGPEGPFDLICCRNVLIYFDHPLQSRVFQKLDDRLKPGGWLLLGQKESLIYHPDFAAYRELEAGRRLFEKRAYP